MPSNLQTPMQSLGLKAGELVEVRSEEEIRLTLDQEGALDGLPFMPELRQYCGRRFRVFKTAHKTCDTIESYTARRMRNAVHLEGLRCDGHAHGGCEARCLIFWKEAWLKRVDGDEPNAGPVDATHGSAVELKTQRDDTDGEDSVYVCQATELLKASSPLPWWSPGQYLRDLVSRNFGVLDMLRGFTLALFNAVQRRRGGLERPYVEGRRDGQTPSRRLGLQPGELVRVKPAEEIFETLDRSWRNRGLWFDREMIPYCGQTARVLAQVGQIIDEKSGKMIRLPNDCVILEGVVCSGLYSRNRLFCPRSIYPYWREIWLERLDVPERPAEEPAPEGAGDRP